MGTSGQTLQEQDKSFRGNLVLQKMSAVPFYTTWQRASFGEKFCMCEDEKKLTFFKEFFNTLYIFMLVIQLINLTNFY